ncbi:MAG: ABC transporter substrate-binding protein [Nostocaceae cyanobacterium]|nr:ABC transporter substrate-binding protein [Nostocaceae cyanobacterium]
MVEIRANRNPYIIGRPINDQKHFFGRESLFHFIEDNLYQGVKVILLHGQRRIGKSSVLRQIPNFVGNDEFVFILFDLQHRSQSHFSDILHDLAKEIIEQLQIEPNKIKLPTLEEINSDTRIFAQRFLSKIFHLINDKKIVFLLDEFDVINNQNQNSTLTPQGLGFFNYLARLIRQQENLFIIPVVGRSLDDMPNLLNLFKQAPYQEIGLLDDLSAKRLITKPSEGILIYEQEAIQEILKLSAGHPYFTQVICFTLFSQAREQSNWNVTRVDVEIVVERIFDDDNAQAGLVWFWDGLPIAEKVVFSAVAEAQEIANNQANNLPEDPLILLDKNHGFKSTETLLEAVDRLAENGFLDNTKRRIKVELVRRWLVKEHPVKREIFELEKLEQEQEYVQQLFSVAFSLYSNNKKKNALEIYHQILELNPNHFLTILELAKLNLEIGNFDQALELYKRAYKFDRIRNKDRFLNALEEYGHRLFLQKEFARAKQQYQRVLQIEPNRLSANHRLAEIAIFQGDISSVNIAFWLRQKQSLKVLLIAGIIAIAIPAVSRVYRLFNPCPTGEQEKFGIICVAYNKNSIPPMSEDEAVKNRISNGNRSIFSDIKNRNRDLGIEAFKERDYKKAAQFFKKAVDDNRNDPEVLIYYNNALSRLRGSPLTLAAVVPAEDGNKEIAQEMLRGIAQAQNQFNKQGGSGGRLLEIVIANDDNDPKQAKLVAAELAKDESILGIIGHNSSSATSAALEEYGKAKLPIISPTSSSIFLNSPVFFRTTPSDAASGKKLAEYAFKNLKLQKVVIFANPNSPYSNSIREEFTKKFERLGGEVVPKSLIHITSPTLDIEKELKDSLFIYQAQAAMLFPDTQHIDVALKIAKANYELMLQLKNHGKEGLKLLAGASLYSNNTLKQGAEAVEGLIVEVPWFREAQEAQDFSQKAIEQWQAPVSWRTATSFDATVAFIKSFSNNPSRKTILEKLKNIKIPASETSGYPLRFNERERQSESILVQVKVGQFVPLTE